MLRGSFREALTPIEQLANFGFDRLQQLDATRKANVAFPLPSGEMCTEFAPRREDADTFVSTFDDELDLHSRFGRE